MIRLVPLLLALALIAAPAWQGAPSSTSPEPPPALLPTAAPASGAEAGEIVPGLRHRLLSRGSVAEDTRYRVVAASHTRQWDADQALARVEATGLPATVQFAEGSYRVLVAELPDADHALAVRERLLAAGLAEPLPIESYAQDLTNPRGPWEIHLLEADSRRVVVEVAHAGDGALGLETTRSLAARRGAAAAINGGYYRMEGSFRGDSLGVLKIDGRLLSEPDRGRGSVGFWRAAGRTRAVFGRLGFRGEVAFADGGSLPIDGVNRPAGAREIVALTPELSAATAPSSAGLWVLVEDGRVVARRSAGDPPEIPAGGFVLALGAEAARQHQDRLTVGAFVSLELALPPLLPDADEEWRRATSMLGGGPLLLWQGRRMEDHAAESISRVFFLARHPRTAVGVRRDGTLLFLVVDGRRPTTSVGMSLPELTELLLELGAVSALNLDGGGSSTMVVGGETVNHPSDGGFERPNADALLLFPSAQR
jgi:hypothetical protein